MSVSSKAFARPHEQVLRLGFQPHLMAPELELPGLRCTSLHPLVTSAGEQNQEGRVSPTQPQLEQCGHSSFWSFCMSADDYKDTTVRTDSELRNKF